MQTIANIGAMTRPEFRKMPTLDLVGALDNYYNARDKQAYINALNSGNQDEINKAFAAYDPQGYANYLQRQNEREQDRQWHLDDLNAQRDFQRELQRNSMNNQLGLAQWRQQQEADALAQEEARLQDALDSGLISPEEYNQKKRENLLGKNLNSPTINENPFEKALVSETAKKYGENVAKAQSTYDEYANADRLLDQIDTGAQYLVPGAAKLKAAFNPAFSEFVAAQNKLIPTMRPTGSGSTSDKDMAIFAKATFGVDKPKEANRNIIRGRMAAAENERDMEQIRADWVTKGGSIVEFNNKWSEYVNSNPIFSSADGKLNKNRKNAREWFYGSRQPSLNQFNQGYSNMSDEELLKGL